MYLGVLEGTFTDFTPDWFEFVGSSLLLTMILNIFTTQVMQFVNAFLKFPFFKYLAKSYDYMQDIIDAYSGLEFFAGLRTATILTTAFVCFFYSGGMPLLYLCGGLLFMVQYYVDAYNILYIFKKPPSYAPYLLLNAIYMIPYGVFIHMMISIWMLSEPSLFYDSYKGDGMYDVLGGGHVYQENSLNFGMRVNLVFITSIAI